MTAGSKLLIGLSAGFLLGEWWALALALLAWPPAYWLLVTGAYRFVTAGAWQIFIAYTMVPAFVGLAIGVLVKQQIARPT